MSTDRDRHHMNFAQDAELLAASASAVYGADHLLKATSHDDEESKTSHLVKASVAAVVAIGAFELLRRGQLPSRSRSRSRSRSFSPDDRSRERSKSHHSGRSGDERHHKAHLTEQVIGAYALGKEMLGDRKHHVGHLVAEAVGGAGLWQELRGREQIEDEDRSGRSRSRR